MAIPLTWNVAKKKRIPDSDLKELHEFGFDLASDKPIASGATAVVFVGKCNEKARRKVLSGSEVGENVWEELTGLCAIKMCVFEFSPGQLREEALRLEDLRHPNIVEVYLNMKSGPHKTSDGHPPEWRRYFVLEFVSDGTLKDRLSLSRKKFSEFEALDLFAQLISGLQFLHRNLVIHNDLHQGNIMLAKDNTGRVIYKIVDFGSALEIRGKRGLKWMERMDVSNLAHHFIKTLEKSDFKNQQLKSSLRLMCDKINFDKLQDMDQINHEFETIVRKKAKVQLESVRQIQ